MFHDRIGVFYSKIVHRRFLPVSDGGLAPFKILVYDKWCGDNRTSTYLRRWSGTKRQKTFYNNGIEDGYRKRVVFFFFVIGTSKRPSHVIFSDDASNEIDDDTTIITVMNVRNNMTRKRKRFADDQRARQTSNLIIGRKRPRVMFLSTLYIIRTTRLCMYMHRRKRFVHDDSLRVV